jgi:Glycosyltransferase family 87
MQPASRNARWVLDPDGLKLVAIIGVFLWVAFLLTARGKLVDFSVLYTSGGVILEGHATKLFDIQTQTEFQQHVIGMSELLPFNHLAYESLLFIPLATLPFEVALWIWRGLSVGMLLLSSCILADVYHGVRTQVGLLALALYPIVLAVAVGQDSILLLLLLSASLAASTREQDRMAGVLIALALFKPHLILPLAAILIWKRGCRFLQGFLVGSVAVVLLSIGITGLRGFGQMVELMRYAAYGTRGQIGGNAKIRPNLRGVLALSGFSAHTAVILTVVISAALFLLIAWNLRNQHSPEILFPPLITFALMSGVYVNAHDLSLLFIPVVAMLGQGRKSTSICAGTCFGMPALRPMGDVFLMCAVLLLTLQRHTATKAEAAASG